MDVWDDQLDAIGPQRHRANDPDTSIAWSEQFLNLTWSERVLRVIDESGLQGAGKPDFARLLGRANVHVFSPIPAPLVRAGLIFDSGMRRDKCIVWMASRCESDHLINLAGEDLARYQQAKFRTGKKYCCPCCNAELHVLDGKLHTTQGELF